MNNLRYVGHDDLLTTEQGAYIKERAVFAARQKFVGRKLFSTIRKIDAGAQTYGYDTLTEVSAATVDMRWPGKQNQDIINLTRSTVGIPNLHKEFELNKIDLASSRQSGTPLNTSTAESAAYKVALLEDKTLIEGYTADGTTYDIKGLYNATGVNSEATSLDWGTSANIITSINNTIALLLADNITGPYNLTIHPTQYAQLLPLITNTAVSYKQWVEQSLGGGSIYVTPAMTESNGMMTPVNTEGMFEYVVAEDLTTETETLSIKEGSNLFGRVYVRGLPVVYDANAICQMTTI